MSVKQKIIIRKAIAQFKRALLYADYNERHDLLHAISYNEELLRNELPGTSMIVNEEKAELPTFGKLKMVIEKDLEQELERYNNDYNKSDVDLKRLALKSAFFDYYNNLDYGPETEIVGYESDMTLRRDNKELEKTDFNFAPNKNEIYQRWMEKLNRYVRENKLKEHEYDESYSRGIPQGGAFEKQLDRYRKQIMQKLWQDYYQQRKD
jgi:hypothetical protein